MEITIYTDGSCSNLTNIGGWAGIIIFDGKEAEISGMELECTNNQMELMAVIKSLLYIYDNNLTTHKLHIYSDSEYVVNGFTKWLQGWKAKNWKKVKNADYWKVMDTLTALLDVDFHWVRGHDGIPLNERVDKLAYAAYKKQTELITDAAKCS